MALIALMVQAGTGFAEDRLAPGAPRLVDLPAGQPVQLGIEAPSGSYLVGRIEAGSDKIDANILAGDGSHFRQLARAGHGSIRLYVVSEGPRMFLELSSEAGGRAEVALDQLVPPEAQIAPDMDYLSPRMSALSKALAKGADTADFWATVANEGTPLVEPDGEGQSIVTFLWRGAKRNARLFGGPSSDHDWLERLGDSDVWYKSFRVPNDTRLSYKIAPDVPVPEGDAWTRRVAILATAQVDPLNRQPWPEIAPDRFNQQSVLVLPDAPEQPGTPPLPEAAPAFQRFTFTSPRLGNSREIVLSHPQNFDPADPELVVALIFDGERAISDMKAPHMLDSLTRQGRLPPVLSVFIPSIDSETRARELPGNADFADVLAGELLPQILNRTGIPPDPQRTVLAGASYGGLGAATIAIRHPEAFGNALSMSGSFWWAPKGAKTDGTPYVAAQIAEAKPLPIRFFLSAGSFETSRGDSDGILQTSRILRDTLRLRGYDAAWREYAAGHDYLVWRGALADGLIALFGGRP
ncbi:enterochelin esterase [Paracoccus aestuariivivens]|uniref:enterochelin esterase n=1 Tax=Paracoccus aestuariivivens TaxID=1820333 RepID=UPI001478F4A9